MNSDLLGKVIFDRSLDINYYKLSDLLSVPDNENLIVAEPFDSLPFTDCTSIFGMQSFTSAFMATLLLSSSRRRYSIQMVWVSSAQISFSYRFVIILEQNSGICPPFLNLHSISEIFSSNSDLSSVTAPAQPSLCTTFMNFVSRSELNTFSCIANSVN